MNGTAGVSGPIRQAFPDIYDGLISSHLAPMGITGQTVGRPLEVMDIERACQIVSEVSERGFKEAEAYLQKSNIPVTGRAAISLCRRVEHLRTGVFRLIEAGELYCAKVLQRSMLDHHLRLLYLHERYWAEWSDNAGMDYAWASDAQEDLSYARTMSNMERIFGGGPESEPKSAHSILLEQFERYRGKDMREIERSALIFGHRTVVAHLVDGIRARMESQSLKPYDNPELLSGYLFMYHQLSSFVHGGAYAEEDLSRAENDERLGRRKVKLLAFYVFQTDLISKCLTFDLLSVVRPDMPRFAEEMNRLTEHVTYPNLLRWEGSMGFLE